MDNAFDPSKLGSTLSSIQLVKYTSLASTVVIFYDYWLTFSSEISLMWPRKWCIMKLIFIASRYLPFFDLLTSFIPQILTFPDDHSCRITFYLAAVSFIFGYFLAELAMSIWVWSLWNRDRRVGTTLIVLFIAAWTAICILQTRYLSSAQVTRSTLAPLSGCFISLDGGPLITSFCVLMAYNFVTFLATLLRTLSIDQHPLTNSGLSHRACANCLFYYVCLLASSVVNLAVVIALPRELINVLIPMQRSMYAIISTRMMLSLRESAIMKGSLVSAV